ncbi:UbiA family prenyltransferase [Nocardia sp. NPDC004722]
MTNPTATPRSLPKNLGFAVAESRPIVQAMFALRFVAGSLLGAASGADPVFGAAYPLRLLAWVLATFAIYVYNGVADAEADRINGVGRPIGRGDLDPVRAGRIAAAAAVLSVVLTLPDLATVPVLLVYLLLGYLYSAQPIKLSRSFPGSALSVFGVGVLIYVAGALAAEVRPSATLLALAVLMAAWMGLIGVNVKDFSDVAGDRESRPWTLVALLPEATVRRIVTGTAVVFAAAAITAAFLLPRLAVVAVVLVAGALAVVVTTRTTTFADPRHRSRRPYYAFMLTQLIANLVLIAQNGLVLLRR